MANQTTATSATSLGASTPASLSFTTADIKGMALGANGSLVITKTDGSTATVDGFRAMADQGAKLTLADGQTIDTHKLFDTLSGTGPIAATEQAHDGAATANLVTIAHPQAGQTTQIALQPGQHYVLGFDPHTASSTTIENGNLVITFADGSKVVIEGYETAAHGANAPVFTLASGEVVHGFDVVGQTAGERNQAVAPEDQTNPRDSTDTAATDTNRTETQTEAQAAATARGEENARDTGDQQALNNVSPTAGTPQPGQTQQQTNAQSDADAKAAQQAAAVEPAAGGTGGAGAASNHGFGFNSFVDSAPLGAPTPVGPIGPTALAFGIPVAQPLGAFIDNDEPTAGTPTISVNGGVPGVIVKEDGSIFVPIVATLGNNALPGEVLTVTVTGIDPSWHITNTDGTYDAATGTFTITLPPNTNYNGGLTFAPPANSDADMTGLNATASAYDANSGTSATTGTGFQIITDAVADTPVITATGASGNENAILPVHIAGGLTDNDGSETITGYRVTGVPAGFTFNHGTDAGGGVWTFTTVDLTGLTASSPTNYFGTLHLDATILTAETNLSDSEVDFSDNNNSATAPFDLTWNPVANPPAINVNNGIDDAIVKEDGSIFVPIVANLDPNGSGNEVLTVTVTGINPAWHITNTDGTYNAATGTWTITLPAGQNYNGGLTFAPPANSDVDMSGLNGHATAFEPATGTSAGADDAFGIITDAVADVPVLDASATSVKQDHGSSTITISGHVTDTDGSEAITGYKISGVPTGFTFNHGTNNNDGSWSFTPAQLTGLTLTPASGFTGGVDLTVTVYNEETHLSDKEVDLTDNTNSASKTLHLDVAPNHQPILLTPAMLNPDETDLSQGTVTVSNTLHADFGFDQPGSFAATSFISSSVPLTSNGAAVSVNLVGDTYIATANGHQIFTLQVAADGQYTFKLTGVLDHPDATNPNDSIALQFGVKAMDSDGDTATGTVTVNVFDDAPTARDDHNVFDLLAGHTDGNVITGAHGGPSAADTASQDTPNHVTAVHFGATTVNVPATGTASIHGDHGTLTIAADGSYTYTLDAGTGQGGGGTTGAAKTFSTTDLFPNEPEGQALPANASYYGVKSGDLTVTDASTGSITAVSEGAGYSNTFGMFEINADGTISSGKVLVVNGNDANFGHANNFGISAGQTAGFFLIADGYTANSGYGGLDLTQGSVEFIYKAGTASERAATVNDSSADVSIVYNDNNGHHMTLNGQDYYSTVQGGSDMNEDGTVRIVAGLVDASNHTTLRVGFEDLPALGDRDYNDFVFDVTIRQNDTSTNGVSDKFTYDLTDADHDTSTAVITFDATPPHFGPPTLVVDNGVHDAVVKEDGSIFVPIVATLDPNGPSSQILTVTVTGINAAWHLTTADGTYNAATGTWTITLPSGQNYNGGLTFAPPANSDADMTGLSVTAKANEPYTGLTASSNGGFDVITDAVADKPTLDVVATPVKEDHGTSSVMISGHVTDTDGSETITGYKITGVPNDFTFNHGTNNGGGTWSFTTAQLSSLTLTPAAGFKGGLDLTVTVYNAETTLSGKEADTSDNTNSTSETLHIEVTANHQPILVTPAMLNADETDLSHGTVTVSNTLHADFGSDNPGSYAATSFISSSVPLTSNGNTVSVNLVGDTYVGSANGQQIFTLQVAADGQYTFKLTGVLDHPDANQANDIIALNFGIKAVDSDGDATTGTITVKVADDAPIAHNDINKFDGTIGHTSGNVVSGLNGGTGAADTLSQDAPNHVTKVSFHGNSVNVPNAGTVDLHGDHGTLTLASNGTYTYVLDHTTGSVISTPHTFTGNAFPTDLSEKTPLSPADSGALGEIHSNMAISANTQVTGQITFNGAAFGNSLGAFVIAADGTLQAAQIINEKITGTDTNFTVNASTGATELGFFLIADGYNTNNGYQNLDLDHGTLKFVYDYAQGDARTATVNDNGNKVSLVFTDMSGHDHVLNGPIYYTTDRGSSNNLNPDGLVHTISGVDGTDTSTLKIGFEDLPRSGDNDYNDTIFSVQLTDKTVACGCGDTFTYTLADNDGDTSQATLSLSCDTPLTAMITVDNGASSEIVKEDGSIFIPVIASTTGDGTQHLTTLAVTGVAAGWIVSGGWTATGNAGEYHLTLPAGQTSYTGGITLAPPANSDADLANLHFTAYAADDHGHSTMTGANFTVITDAVVDVPVLDVPDSVNYLWYVDFNPASGTYGTNPTPLAIASHVTDNDGSEQIQKIVVNLNNPFTNPQGQYDTLHDAGVTLNKGVETAPGVYTITVNAQNAATALNGLQLNTPSSEDYYWALHDGPHSGTITVQTYVSETNLTGAETDLSDNTIVVTKQIAYTFAVSPLIVDLNGDGFNIVGKDAGVHFDMTNDGKADLTSWVGAHDGFLAVDSNHNGLIDSQNELFGNSDTATSGFGKLAAFDSNHDGVINAGDTAFGDLRIWQDVNQDGVSQTNELHSLTDSEIAAISLASVSVNQQVADAYITEIATVTFADGHTGAIGDAWFNVTDADMIGVGVRIDGSAGNDALYGTANNDILAGHGGNDVLHGGAGADQFVLNGAGKAEINDFKISEGDVLDLSHLLSAVGYDPVTDAIHNFVFTTETAGGVAVQFDVTGTGNTAAAQTIAVLGGVHGVSLDDLMASHSVTTA